MAGMDEDTTHYVVFDPEQVKSSIGNVTFDPTSKLITGEWWRQLGGPGSGHHGHAGRKGVKGGSLPGKGGGGAAAVEDSEYVGPSDRHPQVMAAFEEADTAQKTLKRALREYQEISDTGPDRVISAYNQAVDASRKADERAKDVLFDEMSKGFTHGDLMVGSIAKGIDDRIKDDVQQAVKDIGLIDKSNIPLPMLEFEEGSAFDPSGTATPGGRITFASGTKADSVDYNTVTHEIGHQYEFVSPSLRKAAQALQDKRPTRDETLVAPSGASHSPRTTFPNPYSAVRYIPSGWTEVISTGLEAFMRNPAQFRRQDPEHFALILGMLEGKYATR
jgi:hypothetical protein